MALVGTEMNATDKEVCYFLFVSLLLSSTATNRIPMTTLWLRIACGISLLFTVGHTMGGLKRWSPMGDNEVLRQMTAVRFDAMGASRSYLDFYMGFGWSLSIAMALQTMLLWQLASLARTNALGVRPMIAVFALATVVSGVIAWRFIFPLPALFSAALVIALVIAYVVAGHAGVPPVHSA